MTWMNEHDIEDALHQFHGHPVLGPATNTLASLMHGTNRCSDGWAYWRKPSTAARQLQDLIRPGIEVARYFDTERPDATPEKLRKAYAQLRRFRTRYPRCQFRIFAAPGVPGDPEPEVQPDLITIPVRIKVSKTAAGYAVKTIFDWPDGMPVEGEFTGQLRQVVRTATGRELGQAELDALAAEAERGYEVTP